MLRYARAQLGLGLCVLALATPALSQEVSVQGVAAGARAAVAAAPAAGTASEPEPERYQRSPLYLAARAGDVELVRRLLQEGASLDERNRAGLTPLHAAAAAGHTEVTRLLLANCADRDARDYAQRTPLHLAIAAGSGEIVELLLRDGADPIARRPGGSSVLRTAERYRRVELVERLRLAETPRAPVATDGTTPGAALTDVSAGPLDARPRGSDGTRRFVQEKLAELGYDPGPIDGQLGGKTRDAILAFQSRIGQVSRSSTAEVTRCLVDRLAIEAAQRSSDRPAESIRP